VAIGCAANPGPGQDAVVVRARTAAAAAGPNDASAGAGALDRLTAALSQPILTTEPGNVTYSPASIALALGMLRAGATGASARQVDHLFGLPGKDVPTALNGLAHTLAGVRQHVGHDSGHPPVVRLDVADALWGQRGVTWRQPFLNTLARYYSTGVHVLDYEHDSAGARRTVNRWVADHTDGKISDLIPPQAFTPTTRLTLTNAMYLSAPWAEQFSAAGRQEFTTDTGSRSVPMMSADLRTTYHRGDGWQAVTIPYAGRTLAMTVIVPAGHGLAAVQQKLANGALLPAATAPGRTQPVSLTMPPFDLASTVNAKAALQEAGLTAPFTPGTTDLRPMSHDPAAGRLSVTDVLHQATVTVDEHGTEAAAATAVEIGTTAAIARPVPVRLDRPFLFVIHATATGAPLFVGRVSDPTAR